MAIVEKPHQSPSQLETFCMCPERWRRKYLEGEKMPPGIAAIKGMCVHEPAAANFRQKIETFQDLPVEHFKELASETFRTQLAGDFVLSKEEQSRGMKIVLGEAKDEAVKMAEFHATQQAPDYQPILVEEPFRIPLPGPFDLIGFIDLVDSNGIVVDAKTTAKSKNQGEADNSVQLTAYAAGVRLLTGNAPSELRLDVIVNQKTQIKRQILKTNRGRADFSALANRINMVSRAIGSGIFPPAPPGAWWCSPKYCGFWSTCPYVNSERVAAAEANGE